MPTKNQVIETLKEVFDPELNIDIWTLGLIYNIDIIKDKVNIRMTLTSIMCPFGQMLIEIIKEKLKRLEGVMEVNVEIVFNPPWQPSDELRAMLGV